MFDFTTITKPLLLAHRGSRLLAPENTKVAFDLALTHGSDVLEIDVRLTKDRHILVTHDNDVDRTSDGRGKVRDQTLKALKQLDAGYRFIDLNGKHYRGRGIKFETLQDLLALYPTTKFNIDIKDNDIQAARVLAELLLNQACASRVNVGSFHSPIIAEFRRQAPSISTAATQAEVAKLFAYSCLRSKKTVTSAEYRVLQIPRAYRGLQLGTGRFIRYLNDQNLPVMFWTINDPNEMRRLIQNGADGIVTDRTDLARQVFDEMNSSSGTKSKHNTRNG